MTRFFTTTFQSMAPLGRMGMVLIIATFMTSCRKSVETSPAIEVGSEQRELALFKDITETSGIDFHHHTVRDRPYFMPHIVGSGAAFFDFDSDGRLDLYLVQNGGPSSGIVNRLYRQVDVGQFVDVSAGSGTDIDGFGMGAAAGDVNNDGRTDLLVTEYGNARLLINETSGPQPRFVDVTESCHIANPHWGTSASFIDYDRDGWLDIVIVNYVNYDPSRTCTDAKGGRDFCGPDPFPGRATRLFRNLGPQGTEARVDFEDVSIAAGLTNSPGPGLGIFCADFNSDHWPDFFIANDGKPNHLWINKQDGTFVEEATLRGIGCNSVGKSQADMGIAIGDVNGDGLFDVFVTHLSTETHALWRQTKPGFFQDATATSGVLKAAWRGTGFGTVMGDWTNDGWIDLSLVNGRVLRTDAASDQVDPKLDKFWWPYADRNQLFVNDGKGAFVDVSPSNEDFCGTARVARGLACTDIDLDGGIDLLVTNVDGPARLYKNVAANRGHWLSVRTVDPRWKRDAYGAKITVRTGQSSWIRWNNPGYSYLCSNDPRAHFGIGEHANYDSISVLWPDGMEELFPAGTADRLIELVRGAGASQ